MPAATSVPERILTAARWPVGVSYTSWSYIWRITAIHRRELEGSLAQDCPPPIPGDVSLEGVQRVDGGVGPLLHRTYTGAIEDAELSAEELIECLAEDPNRGAPRGLAKFREVRGEEGAMTVGDEYVVRMPGPWDGPVRVVEVTPRSFRFATLEGHLEAGQIEWRGVFDRRLVFRVESWARAGDRLSSLLHHKLLMAKEVQLHMWTSVVEEAAQLAGGRLAHGIDIETRVVRDR